MKRNNLLLVCAVSILLLAERHTASAAELPPEALILDPDIGFYSWPYPTISPDGEWVAYVSHGHICVCKISAPAPRRLMEVPNSWTWPKFTVTKNGQQLTGNYEALCRGLEREEDIALQSQITTSIHGLTWTTDSAGFIVGIQVYDAKKEFTTCDCFLIQRFGEIKKLAHSDAETVTRSTLTGTLTRDGKYLVSPNTMSSSDNYRPLIWDVQQQKPRATPFLHLVPSPTSERWIAIEKDTRQLVILNHEFEVIRRFEEYKPERTYGFDLAWSPDERCVILRNQIGFDHYSDWEGFWLELETGRRRSLEGLAMGEIVAFTGVGGEFMRCGADGEKSKHYTGVIAKEAYLQVIPEPPAQPQDLWRIKLALDRSGPSLYGGMPGNNLQASDSPINLFPLCISYAAHNRSFSVWHVLDRKGKMWRLPGDGGEGYMRPYELAGLAQSSKTIIAYDSTRLFALPVSAVTITENEVEK